MNTAPRLWAADPHQFGPGKVHALDEEDSSKTYCGKIVAVIAGKAVESGKVTCKICSDAPERRRRSRLESALSRLRYEEENAAREAEREQARQEYTARYHAYLQTPKWRAISAAVLRRAGGICEGCGQQPATQAHHLTYDHVFNEFLWELRAVCRGCHERFHDSEPH